MYTTFNSRNVNISTCKVTIKICDQQQPWYVLQ